MSGLVAETRLLHTNYNTIDLPRTEEWYGELFGVRARMRGDGSPKAGLPFGLRTDYRADGAFLYDHRGPRRTSSLELMSWHEPATVGSPYEFPWEYGIQSVAFSTPDLAECLGRVESVGGCVEVQGEGWASLRDPNGVRVEAIEEPGRPEQRYVRIVVADFDRALRWWGDLGFERAKDPQVAGSLFWPGDGERSVAQEALLVPADDPGLGVLLTSWSGPPPVGPTYGAPYHAGLYRIALAVEDVQEAWTVLRRAGVAVQPPYTFTLPGTGIEGGLSILFLHGPEGVLVELVERPRIHFATA